MAAILVQLVDQREAHVVRQDGQVIQHQQVHEGVGAERFAGEFQVGRRGGGAKGLARRAGSGPLRW